MAENWKSGRLRAGKLRHRIDIVRVSPVQDSTGGINWSTDVLYAKVWAAVEAISGDENAAAKSEVSVVTHQVLIRYIGAAPSWQARFQYTPGMLVKDPGGYLQQVQSPGGLSLDVAPPWNETQGMYTEDGDPSIGTFTFLNLGKAPPYTGVTSAMQVLFQGRQFQIKTVLNVDERNKMLALMCVEINDSRQQIPSLNLPSTDLG
jgi:SPP1 family predicted phage head-tail adaptor